jgi:hypothetical protein
LAYANRKTGALQDPPGFLSLTAECMGVIARASSPRATPRALESFKAHFFLVSRFYLDTGFSGSAGTIMAFD